MPFLQRLRLGISIVQFPKTLPLFMLNQSNTLHTLVVKILPAECSLPFLLICTLVVGWYSEAEECGEVRKSVDYYLVQAWVKEKDARSHAPTTIHAHRLVWRRRTPQLHRSTMKSCCDQYEADLELRNHHHTRLNHSDKSEALVHLILLFKNT